MNVPVNPRPCAWQVMGCLLGCAMACLTPARAAEFRLPPSWQPLTRVEAEARILSWLADRGADPSQVAAVRKFWSELSTLPAGEAAGAGSRVEEPDADDVEAGSGRGVNETDSEPRLPLLDWTVQSFALVDADAARLMNQCNNIHEIPPMDSADWLASGSTDRWFRANLQLYFARRLVQEELYDEVLEVLEGLKAGDVVDPATLYFCRMVAHHQLVEPDASRTAMLRLLEQEENLPRRYQQLTRLIEKDLSGLDDESLDHVARRMKDIRRRLGHGDADQRVQEIERGVVESLDDLIKKAEDQQKNSQSSGGGSQSSTPMEDSMPAEQKGPGKVDRRDIGHTSGWGDLPPKQREQALQQVGREFPVHYRELIEKYFRELANQDTTN
jgi:hypothetical protein